MRKQIKEVVTDWKNLAFSILKKLEGFSAKPYSDFKQWSIGYGSYAGALGKPPLMSSISKVEAERLLLDELIPKYYKMYVEGRIKVSVKPNQIAALVSYAYNYPKHVVDVLIPAINRKVDEATLKTLWMQIVNAGGKRNAGLVARRESEWKMYLNGSI